jgi:hypothetical protein
MDESIGNRPINKVTAQTITTVVAAPAIIWTYSELTGRTMPLEVAIIFAGLAGGLIGYLTPLEERIRECLRGNNTREPLPDNPSSN